MVMIKRFLRRLFAFVTRKRFLFTVGTIAGLFILFNYILLPAYVNHGSTLYVPKVVGLSLEEARKALDSIGLQAVESDTRPDPLQPLGIVINQNPQPQAVVKLGRRIYLTMSGGEVLVTVPLLRGRSTRDARFALERYGLKLGTVTYSTSEAFPENTIMDQSVQADSKLPKGSTVGITVSRGKILQESTVPQLIGKTVTEAEKLLLEAGLKVGNITYQPSFDLLPNTVVQQYPRAGEPVPQGRAVDLFVVKVGKPTEEIQVPKK